MTTAPASAAFADDTAPVPDLPRPQPIGVGEYPDALRLHAVVGEGTSPLDGDARARLERHVAPYNAFIADPTDERLAAARASATGPLVPLVELAAYITGRVDEPPSVAAMRAVLDEELLAHGLLVHAAWHVEQGRLALAEEALGEAEGASRTASPALAAQALVQHALLRRQGASPDLAVVGTMLDDAIGLAGDAVPAVQRAEWWLTLGTVWHERAEGTRAHLLQAVRCYQQALRLGLSETVLPELFALAHANLALAYLAMPLADTTQRLRPALAVQSLRAALTVYQRETHPEDWARTQMHLANALVYLPSAHPAENLMQAVELYEELLTVRDRAFDPLGHARVLANQANALAHLGIFDDAVEKLATAHKLFGWHGEDALAAEAREQLERITARRAELADAAGSADA